MKFRPYMVIVVFALIALLFFLNTCSSSSYEPVQDPSEIEDMYEPEAPELQDMYVEPQDGVSMYEPEDPSMSMYSSEYYDEPEYPSMSMSMYEPEDPSMSMYSSEYYDEPDYSSTSMYEPAAATMKPVVTLMPMKDPKTYAIMPGGPTMPMMRTPTPKMCTMDGAVSKDMKGMGADCCSKNGIDAMKNCKPGSLSVQSKMTMGPEKPMCPSTCECPGEITGFNLI
jgi:hypothetical protein